jgi:hypothetical protein
MIMRRLIPVFSLLLPLFTVTGVLAEIPTSSPETRPKTAEQVIEQLCANLKKQRSFTVTMDVTYDAVLDSGAKVQYSAYQNVWVQKPDRLRSDYTGDERITRFFYDGKTFTLEDRQRDLYVTKPAPNTLDKALDQVDQKYGITIPMSNLAANDPCADMLASVTQIIFIGNDMVNREPMYHILLVGSDHDYQMWVTQDATPLLRKAIITYKTLPSSPQYTAILSDWNFNPSMPADTFTFQPGPESIGIELIPATDNDDRIGQ